MQKFLCFIVFFITACSTVTTDKEQSLILKPCCYETGYENTEKNIRIAKPTLPLYLNSKEIVYVQDGIAKSYAHTFWGDLPSNFYRLVLFNKLEHSGLFDAVVEQGDGVGVDLILQSRIEAFEQLFEKNNFYTHIQVSLSLIDAKSLKRLNYTQFSAKKRLENLEISTLRNAFEESLNHIGSWIVSWLDQSLNSE